MAIQLSNKRIEKKYYLSCPIKWTVFAFMPIRHSKNIEQINRLIKILEEIQLINNLIILDKIYHKFKFHTLIQLEKLIKN